MPDNCGGMFSQPVAPGMRGLLHLRGGGSALPYPGFLPQNEIRMLRTNRVLPRPRR
jgi:hypothetical protein